MKISQNPRITSTYCQPAALLIFSAAMERFFAQNNFADGDAPCREAACANRAMKQGLFCLDHHLEQLRAVRILAPIPAGRIFAPYSYLPSA